MKHVIALHYVSLPGGGIASPGEIIDPAAYDLTDGQLARLKGLGAIRAEDNGHIADEERANEDDSEEVTLDIDAADSIVSRTEDAPAAGAGKAKKTAKRGGGA